jgi:hypothetical protein
MRQIETERKIIRSEGSLSPPSQEIPASTCRNAAPSRIAAENARKALQPRPFCRDVARLCEDCEARKACIPKGLGWMTNAPLPRLAGLSYFYFPSDVPYYFSVKLLK